MSEELRQYQLCTVCDRVPCRVVMFPNCGHSCMCQLCAVATKPKSCPRCGECNKTPAARLKVNKSYDNLLRTLYHEDFETSDRPGGEALLHEIQRKQAICRMDLAIARTQKDGDYRAQLPHGYRERALSVINAEYSGEQIGTHVLRWCGCDLPEIPKFSHKSNAFFFGCPCWSPLGKKRHKCVGDSAEDVAPVLSQTDFKYCESFARLSKKQKQVLQL